MCPVFHIFLKLYLPEIENFLLYLHSCLSHCLINLSSYLRDQLHQEVLVEVLYMDHDTVGMAYVVYWDLLDV